jgi:putative PIN family toxin of toxin-antitoxin system
MGGFELVTSRHILDEVSSTFAKPYFVRRLTPDQITRIKDLLEQQSRIVSPDATVVGVATHPEDDLVLATALAGECRYLVTGDRRLRNVSTYRGISIITPAELLEVLRTGKNG